MSCSPWSSVHLFEREYVQGCSMIGRCLSFSCGSDSNRRRIRLCVGVHLSTVSVERDSVNSFLLFSPQKRANLFPGNHWHDARFTCDIPQNILLVCHVGDGIAPGSTLVLKRAGK